MRIVIAVIVAVSAITRLARADADLIGDAPNHFPDYFCTWNIQGYACSYSDSQAQRRAMVEQNLFGHGKFQDWVEFYPSIRSSLFLVLDDSWDVPLSGDKKYFGGLELNAERFPSFTGTTAERLQKLVKAVRSKGWRGLGGWVCAQQAPELATLDDATYWTQRLEWMRDAGVRYWKVDWGEHSGDARWRRRLSELARRIAPDLIVEQALAEGSLKSAAVYRTYDVENVIAAPVTISRIDHLLRVAPKESPTIINCEDEPYVAAGTGAAIGIMRHPFAGVMPNGQQDFVFPPVGRDLKHRLDEVVRCVNWHRIADPIPLSDRGFTIDAQQLKDEWVLAQDETYTAYSPGDRREAAGPARIARGGLPLPSVEVEAGLLMPFVLVSRSPNGSVAIASIGRTQKREYITPEARVVQDVGPARRIGIFGVFKMLTLCFDQAVDQHRICAQDLAGGKSEDITSEVQINGRSVVLPGALISKIGLAAHSEGDVSEPGLLLVVTR